MRAAVYSSKGAAAEVLAVREVPTPEPGDGEVRVRLAYAGVNPTDWKMRAYGAPVAFEYQIPGQDGAGVIDAVGAGVSEARIGERVWVYHCAYQRQWGSAAEYTILPSKQAVRLPDSISLRQGASLGIPYITAYHALTADGSVAGKTVLVSGGAGAVGHAAVEFAIAFEARVITTVSSPEKAEIARKTGAHVVLNYRDADFLEQLKAAAPNGVDRVVEVALGANLEADLSVLNPHCAIATYANEPTDPTIPVRTLMFANTALEFYIVYEFEQSVIDRAISDITLFLENGSINELPTHVFSLDEVALAHEAVENNAVGKVLIAIAPE